MFNGVSVRKRFFLSTAATFLLFTACGNGDARTGAGAAQADPAADPAEVSANGLREAASRPAVRAFYEATGWQAAWDEARAGSLMSALAEAPRHGLHVDGLIADIRGAGSPAAREAAMTNAALILASVLANGRVDPNEIRDIYTLDRPRVEIGAGLRQALGSGDVKGWLDGLAPQTAEYRALSQAYLEHLERAASGGRDEIEGGELIHEGDSDPRVSAIAAALRDYGYLEGRPAAGEGGTFTPQMASALEKLQSDYGISSDGVVGPETLGVLNSGAADRARQLAVNLERRRWLERQPPGTRIDVNTAAAMLDLYRDGEHADRRKVIVGQPGWETPQLGSPIFRLVANPTWTVPKSIEEEEIAPKGESYLRRNNMVRRDGWIVQLPGPDNALGEVKFDMQNDHAIYLHDTPAKHLFRRAQRHFSHGCVRVEDALGFARKLAETDGKLGEFEQAMASGEETFVDLDRNIPVRLVYHTAFVDDSGKVVFRPDPYGWDSEVAEALGLGGGSDRKMQAHVSDVGP